MTKSKRAGDLILMESDLPDNFAKLSIGKPPMNVHLEQSILRSHESHRSKGIQFLMREDMWNAPFIADYAHFACESRHD